jgi:hypothetical protein
MVGALVAAANQVRELPRRRMIQRRHRPVLIAVDWPADNSRMSLPNSGNILKRIAITVALGMAFVIMASIFRPDDSTASDGRRSINRNNPAAVPARQPAENAGASDGVGLAALSADAHAGLQSLGIFESGRHMIAVFATDVGPRYTIIDARSQRELGTLLSAEQVRQLLPEVDLKATDFSAPVDMQPLMLAEPREH